MGRVTSSPFVINPKFTTCWTGHGVRMLHLPSPFIVAIYLKSFSIHASRCVADEVVAVVLLELTNGSPIVPIKKSYSPKLGVVRPYIVVYALLACCFAIVHSIITLSHVLLLLLLSCESVCELL
jgi:hypothetical protein